MPVYVSDLFTATPAAVNASPTSTRTWQWLRGSSAISGATSSTYTAVTADIGSTLSATQLETNFLATTTATSAPTEVVQAFDPIRLFSASEPGVWYDPSDMSTLYQNATGTIPVTSFGQPVGLMLDKSRGLVLGPELAVSTGPVTVSGSGAVTSWSSAPASGRWYRLTYTITASTWTGDLYLEPAQGPFDYRVLSKGVGTYQYTLPAVDAQTASVMQMGGSSPTGSITFSNISVKELPGLHATQSTEASRPLYGIVPVSGRRNLLTYSEQMDNGVWTKTAATVTANTDVAPDGTTTADKLVENATTNQHFLQVSISATSGVVSGFSVYAKAAERGFVILSMGGSPFSGAAANEVWFNLATGAVGTNTGPSDFATITPVGNGWYRCFIGELATATGAALGYIKVSATNGANSYAGDGTSGILIWGAQLETGSTPTAYQRVSTDLDVTEAGVASVGYLRFDGSTSWMVTPTITPGTDKVQVFAGVRKNSDAARAVLVETGAAQTSSFRIEAPNAAAPNYRFASYGSLESLATATSPDYAAPITNVITGLGDISGDLATLRINGTQVVQNTADQGTGNFLAYQMYIGRRGGTTLPLNGHLFPLIVRFGPNLTAARIAATEAWVATKTGGVTL